MRARNLSWSCHAELETVPASAQTKQRKQRKPQPIVCSQCTRCVTPGTLFYRCLDCIGSSRSVTHESGDMRFDNSSRDGTVMATHPNLMLPLRLQQQQIQATSHTAIVENAEHATATKYGADFCSHCCTGLRDPNSETRQSLFLSRREHRTLTLPACARRHISSNSSISGISDMKRHSYVKGYAGTDPVVWSPAHVQNGK